MWVSTYDLCSFCISIASFSMFSTIYLQVSQFYFPLQLNEFTYSLCIGAILSSSDGNLLGLLVLPVVTRAAINMGGHVSLISCKPYKEIGSCRYMCRSGMVGSTSTEIMVADPELKCIIFQKNLTNREISKYTKFGILLTSFCLFIYVYSQPKYLA